MRAEQLEKRQNTWQHSQRASTSLRDKIQNSCIQPVSSSACPPVYTWWLMIRTAEQLEGGGWTATRPKQRHHQRHTHFCYGVDGGVFSAVRAAEPPTPAVLLFWHFGTTRTQGG